MSKGDFAAATCANPLLAIKAYVTEAVPELCMQAYVAGIVQFNAVQFTLVGALPDHLFQHLDLLLFDSDSSRPFAMFDCDSCVRDRNVVECLWMCGWWFLFLVGVGRRVFGERYLGWNGSTD